MELLIGDMSGRRSDRCLRLYFGEVDSDQRAMYDPLREIFRDSIRFHVSTHGR
jgi:hypothetical protein